MVQKVRDRITNTLIQIGSGVTIAVIMFFIYGRSATSQELKRKVDAKVDKSEFIMYSEKNAAEHKEIKLEIKSENNAALKDLEQRLNRQSDIRNADLKDYIKDMLKK